jgi:hypothetical protein
MKIQLERKVIVNTVEQTLIQYGRLVVVEDNVSSIQIHLEQLNLHNTNTIYRNIETNSNYETDKAVHYCTFEDNLMTTIKV